MKFHRLFLIETKEKTKAENKNLHSGNHLVTLKFLTKLYKNPNYLGEELEG